MSKPKYLFVARGPGEAGQARSLAKYISSKGGTILFGLLEKRNLHFFASDKNFKIFLTETPQKLKEVVEKEKPEALLLFNSKIWGGEFLEKPPFEKPPVSVCVDSNWLFNEKKYPHRFVKWTDRYLVLFPKKIFQLGLEKNGGDFVIAPYVLNKIIPVGFIPSYKKPSSTKLSMLRAKYKIKKDEKFIFSYFSGFGAGHRVFAFNNLVASIERLIKKGRKIKVLYVGPTKDINRKLLQKEWLQTEEKLPANEYFLTLASCDLVFQHQGMVTLAQAISAEVPVICNVHLLKDEEPPKVHFWEVNPFARTGACKMFSKSTPIKEITQTIEKLLYNNTAIKKMLKAQRSILEKGEEKSFQITRKLINKKI